LNEAAAIIGIIAEMGFPPIFGFPEGFADGFKGAGGFPLSGGEDIGDLKIGADILGFAFPFNGLDSGGEGAKVMDFGI
jgi:hypothetical protein